MRRYGGPAQWCSFLLFLSAGLFLAFFRELVHGNQGAVIAKLRGVIEGLRAPMAPPPEIVPREDQAQAAGSVQF